MVNAWRNTDAFNDDQGKTETRSSQVYSDLDLFFGRNTINLQRFDLLLSFCPREGL